MSHTRVTHDSFTIERSYRAAPERVFKAWADPAQKRRWFAEGEGWHIDSFDADFRVGGYERTRMRSVNGPIHPGTTSSMMGNDTFHHDIVDNRRIVSSYAMSIGEQRISVSLSTVEIEPAGTGTTLRYTEQAAFLEGGDGTEMRRRGWTQLLESLAKHLDAI